MEKYSVAWFINKFEAIPTEEIGEGDINKHCALWHCGVENYNHPTEEAIALGGLFDPYDETKINAVFKVNDDFTNQFPQLTPKERILNKLRSLQ